MPSALLLVNAASGGGHARRTAPIAEAVLRHHGFEVRRHAIGGFDKTLRLATDAAAKGETVVVIGGDGTVGAVADTLRHVPGAILGIIPAGRGNDLAHALGIPEDPHEACEVIAASVTRAVDMGEVAGKAFLGIGYAGLDSAANTLANEAPKHLGHFAYLYGFLGALFFWHPVHFELTFPEQEPYAFTGYSVAAANTSIYGGGMHLAPEALPDDGLLDVIAIARVSKLRLLWSFRKIFKGTHIDLSWVHSFRATSVSITSSRDLALYGDGEPLAELLAGVATEIRALPHALQVLVPKEGVQGAK